jgi:methionine-rich copper-binding protein CopC
VLKLPNDPELGKAGLGSVSINAVSDDAHVIGGTAISPIADSSKPFAPVIYRCR